LFTDTGGLSSTETVVISIFTEECLRNCLQFRVTSSLAIALTVLKHFPYYSRNICSLNIEICLMRAIYFPALFTSLVHVYKMLGHVWWHLLTDAFGTLFNCSSLCSPNTSKWKPSFGFSCLPSPWNKSLWQFF